MDQFFLNAGEFMLKHFSMLKVFVFCTLLSAAFLVVVPTTFKAWLSWKSTKKQANLSISVILATTFLYMFSATYPMFIQDVLEISNQISGNVRSLVFIGLISFISFYSVPRAVYYYQSLAETKSAKSFSLMCFFALISFYSLSALIMPTIALSIISAS